MRNFILVSLLFPEHVLPCNVASLFVLVSNQIVNSVPNEVIVVVATNREVPIERIIHQEEIIIGLSSRYLNLLYYTKLLHFLDHSEFDASHELLNILDKDICELLWKHKVFAVF